MSQAVTPIVVVAASGQDLPVLPAEVRIVRDEITGRGPLQGLSAALKALHGLAEAAFVSGCDTPFLNPAFVKRLFELLGPAMVCVPRVNDIYHPLAAVYRLETLAAVERLLAEGALRTMGLFDRVATRVVTEDELAEVDPQGLSLRNLNCWEDYETALQAHQNALA